MKHFELLLVLLLLVACSNGQKGTKFEPKEREQAFASDEARQAAIEKKRTELDSLNLDMKTLVFDNNIKLTVLPPVPTEDITEESATLLTGKMMQIIAQNGIGGYGNNPAFALAVVMAPTGRATTGTAPQRMMTKYTVTYVVANMLTGDVYASHSDDIEGVGGSFTEASRNAINNIKNTPALQQMLKTASDRIVSWYNHVDGFKSAVEEYVARQDFETAYALLASVPQNSPTCMTYAKSRQNKVLEDMKNQKAAETLADLKNAIAVSSERYNPMAAGYLNMIPENSRHYAEASKLYNNYLQHIQDVRQDSIRHEQKLELERLAYEQAKLEHQQKASMKVANHAVSRPLASSDSTSDGCTGSRIMASFKKHPFLWGLGAGAVITGVAGIALYSSLPMLAKFGLALL